MTAMASQITSLTIVYSIVYSGADQRKYQSSASLAFVRGSHRWLVNSPHKGPVTRKMFPFDDVIMLSKHSVISFTELVSKLSPTEGETHLAPISLVLRRGTVTFLSFSALVAGIICRLVYPPEDFRAELSPIENITQSVPVLGGRDAAVLCWILRTTPDSKAHGTNMGPAWGRQDPCGPHVDLVNLAILDRIRFSTFLVSCYIVIRHVITRSQEVWKSRDIHLGLYKLPQIRPVPLQHFCWCAFYISGHHRHLKNPISLLLDFARGCDTIEHDIP